VLDDESALLDGAQADDGFRRELVETGQAGLDGTRFQHPAAPPEDPRREHPLSWLAGPVAPLGPLSGITSQNPAGQRTAPTTRAIATTLLQIKALMPAFHSAEMQNHGNRPRRVPSRTMRPCEPQNTWVARSGETGVDTSAEVVPRPTLSGSCFA
jgi:hypothetical protein